MGTSVSPCLAVHARVRGGAAEGGHHGVILLHQVERLQGEQGDAWRALKSSVRELYALKESVPCREGGVHWYTVST